MKTFFQWVESQNPYIDQDTGAILDGEKYRQWELRQRNRKIPLMDQGQINSMIEIAIKQGWTLDKFKRALDSRMISKDFQDKKIIPLFINQLKYRNTMSRRQ